MWYTFYMGYLESVTIENFQSIKKVNLDFAPGLTTIVGQSSTGKSAILRAIQTLTYNTKSPQLRAGAKSLTVSATLGSGQTVSVKRGKSLSTYAVDEEQYTKAGVNVPDPVAKVLGLGKVEPDVHFSFQFDKPYLIAESGSTISGVLAKLTQANVLREAVREGAKVAQQHTQLARQRRSDVEELKQRLEDEYSDLPAKKTQLEEVRKYVEDAKKIFVEVETTKQTLANIDRLTALVESIHVVEVRDVTPALDYAEQLAKDSRGLENVVMAYEYATKAVETCTANLKTADENVAKVEALIESLTNQLEVCPTCGQVVVH